MELAQRESSLDHRAAVSEEIRALMGRRRVSQVGLADALGQSQSTVSRKLRGDTPWDIDELFAMAAFFGVDVAALLGVEGHLPPYPDLQLVQGQAGQLSFDDSAWSSASPRRSHLTPV